MHEEIYISVIIPIYNVAPYLDDCLNSISPQSNINIEIITINDGSTDNSIEILKKHRGKNTQIRIIDLKVNHGIGYVRNLGVREALGKYIFFVDSDDWLQDEACEILLKKTKEEDFDIITFGFKIYEEYDSGPRKNKTTMLLPSKNINQSDYFKHCLTATEGFLPYVWKYLFRKEFIINNQLYFSEDIYFEDVPFTVRAFYFCKKLGLIRHSLYNYRLRNFSITDSTSKKKIDDSLTAHFMIKTFLENENVFNKYKSEFVIRLLSCCLSPCFKDYLLISKKEKDNDLIEFMAVLRKGPLLSSSNLELLKRFGEKIVIESGKSKAKFYMEAYDFLIAIRYMYGFTKTTFMIKRLISKK